MPDESHAKQILTAPPWRTGGDHRDAPVLHGWRLPSKTWNHWTSPGKKQLTWLRIIHSAEWYIRLALCTPSGACQKWMNEWQQSIIHPQRTLTQVRLKVQVTRTSEARTRGAFSVTHKRISTSPFKNKIWWNCLNVLQTFIPPYCLYVVDNVHSWWYQNYVISLLYNVQIINTILYAYSYGLSITAPMQKELVRVQLVLIRTRINVKGCYWNTCKLVLTITHTRVTGLILVSMWNCECILRRCKEFRIKIKWIKTIHPVLYRVWQIKVILLPCFLISRQRIGTFIRKFTRLFLIRMYI